MVKQRRYQIVRQHADQSHRDHLKVIRSGLSLEQAQAHCRRDDTHQVSDTGLVVWFDGYEREQPMLTHRATVYEIPTLFRWRGGIYVDVMPLGNAVDVINVTDKRIGSRRDLEQICDAYIEQLDRHDWRHGYCASLVACDCARCSRDR